MSKRLTLKQQDFIEFYAGNATEAARAAGYKNPRRAGNRLLTNVDIQNAVQARHEQDPKRTQKIANREERQTYWSKIMRDEKQSMKDRLRASELLGKSEGDFITRLEHTGEDGGPLQLKHELGPELREMINEII